MRLETRRFWTHVLLTASLGGLFGMLMETSLPTERVPREVLLLGAIQDPTEAAVGPSDSRAFFAIRLCELVGGDSHENIDCLMPLGPMKTAVHPDFAAVELSQALLRWRKALDQLEQSSAPHSQSGWIVASLRARVNQIEDLLRPEAVTYERLFRAALLSEGLRYNSLSGRFSTIRWDLARVFDDRARLASRSLLLEQALGLISVGFGLLVGCVCWVAIRRHDWTALLIVLIGMTALGMGLAVIADASLRFGEGAYGFAINPFSYALPRQALSIIGCLGLSLVVVYRPQLIKGAAERCLRNIPWVSILGGVVTLTSYLALSPAAGSEALKIWVALIASLALTRFARAADTARSVVPGLWNPRSLLRSIWGRLLSLMTQQERDQAPQRAADFIRFRLFWALSGIFLMGMFVLSMTVAAFNDLGGTLLSASIFWALLALLFGPSIGFWALIAGGLLSFLASQTDKVAGRLELMLTPMSALISDFARLEKFREAASESGYGIGKIQWCSFEGSCVPLQSISDYMPILVISSIGQLPSLLLVGGLGIFYLSMMVTAIRGIGRHHGAIRVIYSLGFFLLIAALVQSSLTILGSFRLTPLTGLGLPLFSLGLSSLLSVLLAPALLSAATHLSKSEAGLS